MKLKIYIPTMSRVAKQSTLSKLPEKLQAAVTLVCPPEDVKPLRERHKDTNVLACPAKGIAATRQWIMDYSRKAGHERIVMLDDDLTLQKRREGGRITNLEGPEFMEAFQWLDNALKVHAAATFGPRFLSYDLKGEEWLNKRQMYVLGYNVKAVHEVKASFTKGLPEMPVMEDFHMTLQLLKAGRSNTLSLVWRVSPYAANAPGGCSTWRTVERQNATARALEKLHAPFVVVKEKKAWKGMASAQGVASEQRLDVVVYWQKAAKAGGVL